MIMKYEKIKDKLIPDANERIKIQDGKVTDPMSVQQVNDELIQETTDIFICDYKRLNGMHFNAENARFIIDGLEYNILLIDDVEGRHEHLEVYLKFIGLGQTR